MNCHRHLINHLNPQPQPQPLKTCNNMNISKQVQDVENIQAEDIQQILDVFPHITSSQAISVLASFGSNVERAIDYILTSGSIPSNESVTGETDPQISQAINTIDYFSTANQINQINPYSNNLNGELIDDNNNNNDDDDDDDDDGDGDGNDNISYDDDDKNKYEISKEANEQILRNIFLRFLSLLDNNYFSSKHLETCNLSQLEKELEKYLSRRSDIRKKCNYPLFDKYIELRCNLNKVMSKPESKSIKKESMSTTQSCFMDSCQLNTLPFEVVLMIFSYLDIDFIFTTCRLVCACWNSWIVSPSLPTHTHIHNLPLLLIPRHLSYEKDIILLRRRFFNRFFRSHMKNVEVLDLRGLIQSNNCSSYRHDDDDSLEIYSTDVQIFIIRMLENASNLKEFIIEEINCEILTALQYFCSKTLKRIQIGNMINEKQLVAFFKACKCLTHIDGISISHQQSELIESLSHLNLEKLELRLTSYQFNLNTNLKKLLNNSKDSLKELTVVCDDGIDNDIQVDEQIKDIIVLPSVEIFHNITGSCEIDISQLSLPNCRRLTMLLTSDNVVENLTWIAKQAPLVEELFLSCFTNLSDHIQILHQILARLKKLVLVINSEMDLVWLKKLFPPSSSSTLPSSGAIEVTSTSASGGNKIQHMLQSDFELYIIVEENIASFEDVEEGGHSLVDFCNHCRQYLNGCLSSVNLDDLISNLFVTSIYEKIKALTITEIFKLEDLKILSSIFSEKKLDYVECTISMLPLVSEHLINFLKLEKVVILFDDLSTDFYHKLEKDMLLSTLQQSKDITLLEQDIFETASSENCIDLSELLNHIEQNQIQNKTLIPKVLSVKHVTVRLDYEPDLFIPILSIYFPNIECLNIEYTMKAENDYSHLNENQNESLIDQLEWGLFGGEYSTEIGNEEWNQIIAEEYESIQNTGFIDNEMNEKIKQMVDSLNSMPNLQSLSISSSIHPFYLQSLMIEIAKRSIESEKKSKFKLKELIVKSVAPNFLLSGGFYQKITRLNPYLHIKVGLFKLYSQWR